MTAQSFHRLLTILNRHEVEFIVVGGVAAVLQGAPVTTFDLDALILIEDGNADSLLSALSELDARMREHAETLRPSKEHLLAGGHLLLMTDAGPLDLLGFVGNQERYEDLKESTDTITLEGRSVKVLNLETLIRLKKDLGRAKDRAMLELLEEVARRRRSSC